MILGQGSYGEVSVKDGKAVKKFGKLSHLIQEYMALQYLNDCAYVVHSRGVDFVNLELYMDLYDCSLRKWLEDQREREGANRTDIMKILHDILLGLIELHDRELAHGDLKPGNILIKRNPLKIVLGDCGFVSVAKYAKVDRTAAIYRDPIVSHDSTHDMFSFGICFLEMIAEIKINRQANYNELKQVVRDKVSDFEYRKIIYNLLHSDKERRPSARAVLYRLFHENPPKWERPSNLLSGSSDEIKDSTKSTALTPIHPKGTPILDSINIIENTKVLPTKHPKPLPVDQTKGDLPHTIISILHEDRQYIRSLMKGTAFEFEINRGKKGYGALLSYIDNHHIESSLHRIYTAITLMILSSIFGKSGFREQQVIELCERKYSTTLIYKILEKMLSDRVFISILLAP